MFDKLQRARITSEHRPCVADCVVLLLAGPAQCASVSHSIASDHTRRRTEEASGDCDTLRVGTAYIV